MRLCFTPNATIPRPNNVWGAMRDNVHVKQMWRNVNRKEL
jgi:hypothetical protein